MASDRSTPVRTKRFPWTFISIVFGLSVVAWFAGPVAERALGRDLPIDVPISSLMAFCPIISATILVQRERGWEGVKKLLKRALDLRRIKEKAWYVPILLIMPTVMVLQYALRNPARVPVPDSQFPISMAAVFALVFLVAAMGEEVGWQGYAVEPLLDRWNALTASVVLGMVWAIWHIVPLIQLQRTPVQIAWQCVDMVATRVLIVWLYRNTGKSVFAAILYHAMYNVSTLLLPNYGLSYDPAATAILVAMVAIVVTWLWGPKTLAGYRYARLGG